MADVVDTVPLRAQSSWPMCLPPRPMTRSIADSPTPSRHSKSPAAAVLVGYECTVIRDLRGSPAGVTCKLSRSCSHPAPAPGDPDSGEPEPRTTKGASDASKRRRTIRVQGMWSGTRLREAMPLPAGDGARGDLLREADEASNAEVEGVVRPRPRAEALRSSDQCRQRGRP